MKTAEQQSLRFGGRMLADGAPLVMGIVNCTPDSFYDRGRTFSPEAALQAAEVAIAAGADIIDIGGVKAGLGAEVTAAEEIRRVRDVVRALRERQPDTLISVDTWRAEVADEVLRAGADIINDAWEGPDPELPAIVAAHDAGLVCTHAGHLPPRTDPVDPHYADVIADIIETVVGLAERAVGSGVHPGSILVDPGHDFGKLTVHSLEVTRRLAELVATGWPVLVAVSNKDFIGESLGLPVEQRIPGTMAALSVAAWLGARVFRVHNVTEARQVVDMVACIRGDQPPRLARRGISGQ